ncbi:vancomycin permeability regulator SanA [Krasilnikovia cinnamomea]|uniref:Vancomycin permeability regulator SanA n=1 Tax=Krasilnikovia cinnamomea TaxID=349313 RepID=A0A4Q7ZE33_9ACTN|nr:ElyC/SanA/YdcF family protein [Krasilnikovia cinnamomea]RZU48918.1 vancomycin permeability regulator SanA [Krasilnikovia cinnamomea]
MRKITLRRALRRLVAVGALGAAAAVLAMAAGALWARAGADGHVYAVDAVPAAPVALVLGAQVDPGGVPSPFLAARLEIARQLYADGKVGAILVSGDHGRWEYNEPGAMFHWLVDHGVPSQQIVLDHAGFDTYDSCARASQIFGVRQAIVVTQSYHIDRAVALCRHLGVDASGVGDDTVRIYRQPWLHSATRERGAVVKALFDVASGRDPVFLGRQETGVEAALS